MSHLLTTFFWANSSFSGSGQDNEGPFHVGNVNKFFRFEVRGEVNYQGATVSTSSVFANIIAWGVQIVPHGNSPEDVVTSADSDTWLMRRQVGSEDSFTTWAPSTDDAGVLASNAIADDWAGQLALGGADMDCYLSLKPTTGSVANANTFGTIRLWWL
jgi:hypothetical protein